MKVGIAVPTIGGFGEEGRYNRQELGLGKAIVRAGHEVVVVKCYDRRGPAPAPTGGLPPGLRLIDVPARGFGTQALVSPACLEGLGLDRLVVFGDVQNSVPAWAAWCARNGVRFVPYLGTIRSDARRGAWIGNALGRRNLAVYRRHRCFAKTPAVAEELRAAGVADVRLMPVGLDPDRLAAGAERSRAEARAALGVPDDGPLVGFVGRLAPYKDPLALVAAIGELSRTSPDVRLAMVGDGPMAGEVDAALAAAGLTARTTRVPALRQDEMWRLYRAVDVLANLNPREIFGMALLEALYFGCPVVAVDAPGPRLILEDTPGILVRAGDAAAFAGALAAAIRAGRAGDPVWRARVEARFTWDGSIASAGLLD